ncbi:uncharacterized protein LOC116347528 [Contarinia nasturtii]|uniref:uncharacterized protein LOC116347528 n=1 Tax=Contarinia nasturtii TaxID=265458 RepID=UPI0012D41C26|nr:uncharacterized protein LOC116347528 [Contarinia nasturtii]
MHRLCPSENKENIFGECIQSDSKSMTSSKRKRHPLDSINPNTAKIEMKSSTAIERVNYDCFERILDGFHLDDLVKVGSSCKHLQSIVCDFFQTKFHKHAVLIDSEQFPRYAVTSNAVHDNYRFGIGHDLNAFLNVVGEKIEKIIILNMFPIAANLTRFENDTKIEQMITKCCGKTLNEIKFKNCGQQMMNGAEPFENVTRVSFENCALGRKASDFTFLFPIMYRFDLIDCNVMDVRHSIEMEFPKLKCFNLNVPLSLNSYANISFNIQNIMAMIDRNPHIESLKLCYWNESAYDAKLLHYVAQKLNDLKNLQLWHLRYTEFFSHGDIHFNSVRKLTLANHCHISGKLAANLAALSFENLSKFCITGEFDSECTAFLARHKTIRAISFVSSGAHDWYPSEADVIGIVNLLPNLVKITLDGSRLTAHGLLRLIKQCSTMVLSLKIQRYAFSNAIRKMFQWECTKLGWHVNFNSLSTDPKMKIQRKIN